MTSTKVIKTLMEDGKVEYEYLFEVLQNYVSKSAILPNNNSEILDGSSEKFLVKSLLGVLKTFVGDKQVVIGLGPGRCGTMSLAMILAMQRSVVVHHESEPGLNWDADIYAFIGKWARLFYHVTPVLPIIADVAHWYLPFVPNILEVNPTAKFVCLKRDIEKIVTSFMYKVPDTSHWTIKYCKHWHEKWNRGHAYRERFPHYDLPKEEGCRHYVTKYYKACEDYTQQIPNNFRIFDIEALNTEKGVRSILEFCGLSEEDMNFEGSISIHVNQITDSHRKQIRRLKNEFGEDF
jgi:hypothetical protein